MIIILLVLVIAFLLAILSCALTPKQSFVIGPPPPRTIIVPADYVSSIGANSVEYRDALYPDPRWGVIENNAHPYHPKVWLVIKGGKKILIGPAEKHLTPEFSIGEIRWLQFPFGTHILHIERWYCFDKTWARVGKVDVAKLKIKRFVKWDSEEQWGWKIVINQDSILVYNKGDY